MKFHSDPVEEHGEVSLPDEGALEAIAEHWTPAAVGEGIACYVVSVGVWRSEAHRTAQLGEILGLVEAHGDTVVGQESLKVSKPNPRTHLGRGGCEAVAQRARAAGATLLVIDAQLSPSQTRNLEDATGFSVSDREIVILGVFHKHARSRTARIQVEIAHLEYLRPRIRGLGLDMDQQAGGVMNGRGAGETASELMARRLDTRLVVLRRSLAKLERAGELRRARRETTNRIALVGYTNAGKTSLMNGLTGAGLSTRSRPFETLDTTSRCLTRHGGEVVIGDTVGFIRDLPDRLLASFASTLAEARQASLLVVVVDLSDPEWGMHLATTEDQLTRLGADRIPRFYVFNKVDRLKGPVPGQAIHAACSRGESELDRRTDPYRVLSSLDLVAVATLREELIAAVRRESHRTATVFVPYSAPNLSCEIYRTCRVTEAEAEEEGVRFTIEGPAHRIDKLVALAEVC